MSGKHVQNYIAIKELNNKKVDKKQVNENIENEIINSLIERVNTLEATVKDIVEKITNVKVDNKKRTK